ncbi:MAG: galactose-1-phosphate uridylyltransferase [Nanoarchaeota archaeon]
MELRKDYLLERYVIIATQRSKRPRQFVQAEEKEETLNSTCFFCPGNEETTPPEISRREDEDGWYMRVVPNKFPAVTSGEKTELETHNKFFMFSEAVGFHEVLVETPEHSEQLWDFNEKRLSEVFEVYSERLIELKKRENVKYVSIFKNHGKKGGASIFHSHSQIIGYNLLPSEIEEREKACQKYEGCPYCEIINVEKNSQRAVFEDSNVVCFTPYASRFPFETWIMPKRHVLALYELESDEIKSFSKALLGVLNKLKELNAPYNFYIRYGIRNMHLHMEVTPRLSNWAGFEFATGTVINSVSPEDGAHFFRERFRGGF